MSVGSPVPTTMESVMLSSFVPSSRPLRATAHRLAAGVAFFALGYLVALIVSPATESPFVAAFARAAAAKHAAADAGHGRGAASPALIMEPRSDLDYFPDHYINQAREVAEQPPTF